MESKISLIIQVVILGDGVHLEDRLLLARCEFQFVRTPGRRFSVAWSSGIDISTTDQLQYGLYYSLLSLNQHSWYIDALWKPAFWSSRKDDGGTRRRLTVICPVADHRQSCSIITLFHPHTRMMLRWVEEDRTRRGSFSVESPIKSYHEYWVLWSHANFLLSTFLYKARFFLLSPTLVLPRQPSFLHFLSRLYLTFELIQSAATQLLFEPRSPVWLQLHHFNLRADFLSTCVS